MPKRILKITTPIIEVLLAPVKSKKILDGTRLTINSGIGYRKLSNDKSSFTGDYIFIDYHEEGNSRARIGLELRASSFENMSKKILIPFETSETTKNNLIKNNFKIFSFFEKNSDLRKTAKKYLCTHYLENNKIKKI